MWKHYDFTAVESTSIQFATSLDEVKKVVSAWAYEKRIKNDHVLTEIKPV
jgi:hypothetical protein